MSTTANNSKYTDFIVNRLVVNSLEEDGAICNDATKEYDEQATYEGGSGSRYSFTKYNNKIIDYHNILKILTGEQRANIRESIPTIDFVNTSNTSFMNTYGFDDNGGIDPTTIYNIYNDSNSTSPTPALQYIEEEDNHIINRALSGDKQLEEHFYNSSGQIVSSYNLQTAPYEGEYSYTYHGIKSNRIVDIYGEIHEATITREIFYIGNDNETTSVTGWIDFDPIENTFNPDEEMNENNISFITPHGNTIPCLNSVIGESTDEENAVRFIYQKEGSTGGTTAYQYSLEISPDDLVVILPSTSYTTDPCRILIFKSNSSYSPSIDEMLNNPEGVQEVMQQPYSFYILYVESYNTSITLETLTSGSEINSKYYDESIIDKLNDYLNIERNCFSEASGLLNGYYCEPYEVTDMGDAGEKVVKWKLEDDTERAAEHNVSIDVGSKYYDGHLLGRGIPIDSPLKTTDPSETEPRNDPFTGQALSIPTGKATHIYDVLASATTNLFDPVSVPYNTWNQFNLTTLDKVISKYDYSGEKLGSAEIYDYTGSKVNQGSVLSTNNVKYPKKFKNDSGETFTYKDFQNYISNCRETINGTQIRLDLGRDDTTSYTEDVYESGALNTGCIQNKVGTYGPGNQIYNKGECLWYVKWRYLYKNKQKGTLDQCKKLSIEVASPINAWGPKNSVDTFLVYPEYQKYIPQELYLISRNNLGLEIYNDLYGTEDGEGNINNTPTRGMCSFYTTSSNVNKTLANWLNSLFGINNNETEADGKEKLIAFKVDDIMEFTPSKCTSISFRNPRLNNWVTENLIPSDIFEGLSYFNSEFCVKGGSSNDCYVYVLKPMSISLGGVEIKNWNNEVMDLSETIGNLEIVPLAYPNNYFPAEVKMGANNEYKYELPVENRSKDINFLNNSYIIPGLPQVNSINDYRKYKKDGLSLGIFADLMSDSDGAGYMLNSILKQSLNNVLYNWPISDSSTNPIIIGNFSELLKGLTEITPALDRLIDADYRIPVETSSTETSNRTIQTSDLEGLYDRISNRTTDTEVAININDNSESWKFDSDDTFENNLLSRLNCLSFQVSQSPETIRPSLKELYKLIKSSFDPQAVLTRENCVALDKYLGNGTSAFLKFGNIDNLEGSPNNITTFTDILGQKIVDLTLEVDRAYKNDLIEDIYKRYYKVDAEGNLPHNDKGLIDTSKLQIEYVNPDVSKQLDYYRTHSNALNIKVNNFFNWLSLWGIQSRWKSMPLKKWMYHMGYWYGSENGDGKTGNKVPVYYSTDYRTPEPSITASLKSWINSQITSQINALTSSGTTYPLNDNDVLNYLYGMDNNEQERFNVDETFDDSIYHLNMNMTIPSYSSNKDSLVPSQLSFSIPEITYEPEKADISALTLESIASFVRSSLEGTGDASYYVKYVEGDKELTGRSNSLYYKRYQMLNNRMNRMQGPLYNAARYLNNKNNFTAVNEYSENLEESYRKFVEIIPVEEHTQLSYFPKQQASANTVEMEGKFYYEDELEALRQEISSKCVLTCNYCEVRNSCPFYNEEEILKLYCDEAQAIELWFKDNELDLIYYDEDNEHNGQYSSPNLKLIEGGEESTNNEEFINKMQTIHYPYADITQKITDSTSTIYKANSLEDLREEISSKIPNSNDELGDGLGFLLNGRYGTIQKNTLSNISSLLDTSEINVENIPKYTYMYDALFINDLETEFVYAPSKTDYDVILTTGVWGEKKTYRGTTKIKIPVTLKILANANPNDDVYLVSDDLKDEAGNTISPVIYINTVGNLSYTFDLTETGKDEECTNSQDTKLYAKDIAQWCINYVKGNCIDDPIGSHDDQNLDRDQYWMETIYKKIVTPTGSTSWLKLPGRKRVNSGYQEPIMDESTYDEMSVISGKQAVNLYKNFIRKFAINMSCVRWVKGESEGSTSDEVELKRSILPLMKTNLRLCVVHNPVSTIKPQDNTTN